jgi:hypothetical protein
MSGELRKLHKLMRLRHWLGQLLANARRHSRERHHAKLNGMWDLIVGSCQIRSPFSETHYRGLVVAYARRIYPGAKIFERD